jgi:hypothetical protein
MVEDSIISDRDDYRMVNGRNIFVKITSIWWEIPFTAFVRLAFEAFLQLDWKIHH